MLILGTAGHIDHGKTSLIRALTGTDTDRLPEEKARGITIELGFAALDLPDGTRLGVVDVPGHEGLVRTMVAGATGIDLVLLVVAADEGVMPQTREHLAICRLLGVSRAVVALTKVDLADDDLAELAEADVRDQLAGTLLADAPVLRVSSTTGEGIDALREALASAAAETAPRTPREGPPRLPVDRCFAARGFGAVVTGTLVGGALSVGDAVELQPGATPARVRGLQRHGRDADRLGPGARCAVNLQGIELETLSRGQVVTLPGALEPAETLDVRLVWLDVAPRCDEPFSVELLTGTAERRARVAPIGSDALEPGSEGFARIHVEGPRLPALPGDRFVLRGFARTAMGGTTLGGGTVLDAAPPRRRRSDPVLLAELEELATLEPTRCLAARIRRGGLAGTDAETLGRDTGLTRAARDAALAELARESGARATASGAWISAEAAAELEQRALEALAAYHAELPIQPGMPVAALRGALPGNVPREIAELVLEDLRARGELALEADRARLPSHAARLDPEQEALAGRVLEQAREAALEPPGLREWAESLGVAGDALQDLLVHLEREGRLVRSRDLWFDADAVADLRARVLAFLAEHERLDTPDYKALIGTSRRTAVPLMELLDEAHVTLRREDTRILHPSARDGLTD
jgi:selenocysteine-specific elongation factor